MKHHGSVYYAAYRWKRLSALSYKSIDIVFVGNIARLDDNFGSISSLVNELL